MARPTTQTEERGFYPGRIFCWHRSRRDVRGTAICLGRTLKMPPPPPANHYLRITHLQNMKDPCVTKALAGMSINRGVIDEGMYPKLGQTMLFSFLTTVSTMCSGRMPYRLCGKRPIGVPPPPPRRRQASGCQQQSRRQIPRSLFPKADASSQPPCDCLDPQSRPALLLSS